MRAPAAYSLFATPIGRCGIAWRGECICGVALPDRDDAATIVALRRGASDLALGEPPAQVQDAIARIKDLLAGAKVSFATIPLDLDGTSAFERDVYAQTIEIAAGMTRTYGEIAKALGDPLAARAVGRALGRNPVPIIVPCHRVLAANGKLGGFSAPGGRNAKLALLDIEKARTPGGPTLFDVAPIRDHASAASESIAR